MFCEKLPNGKVRYGEYYKDPLTLKNKKVSVCMDKDSPSNRKKAIAELTLRIQKITSIDNNEKLTFQQLLDEYLEYQAKTVEQSTYRRNKSTLQRFLKVIGPSTLVNSTTAYHIKKLYLPDNESDITTSNEYIRRIKAMLSWGYENELVTDYALPSKLKYYKTSVSKKDKIKDKYLEPDELNGILNNLKNKNLMHWYYFTLFLALSGLRIGEAIALNDNDVNIKEKIISVSKTYDIGGNLITDPKTYASNRDVYIQPELESVIKEYIFFRDTNHKLRKIKSTLFFSNDLGQRYKYEAYRKQLMLAAKGVTTKKVTPHILRHTHASLLMSHGVNIDTISRRLGHGDSKVTKEIYLHITKLLIKKDNSQLNQVNLL